MILRGPRLAVVGFDSDMALLGIRRLAEYMSAWDIPCNVYVSQAVNAELRRPEGSPSANTRPLDELAEQPWQRVTDVESLSIGGDLTLFALTAVSTGDGISSGDLETVSATETPIVLVASEPDRPTALRAAHSWPVEVAGLLLVPAHGHGPLTYDKVTTLPRTPLVDELTDPSTVGPESESIVRAGALLTLANQAPTLLTMETPAEGDVAEHVLPPLYPDNRQPAGRTMMVSATHSDAGKTFLVTALARYYADQGLRVAPFKGQNMSNNARVVRGGEIGVAQYIQALAARIVPDVRNNPVLIKPQDTTSHVLVLGRYDGELSKLPWRLRKPPSWPAVRRALRELRETHDLIIMEGAGSPAEPFQYHNDIVNMRVARELATPTFVVTDGARGGGIAHCYGTWRLLPTRDRALVKGFIINRFFAKGNPAMLQPGCTQLERLTSVPTMGIIPEVPYTLPEEDSYSMARAARGQAGLRAAIVAYPNISNFDEFHPIASSGVAELRWARSPEDLADADLVVLPGSKDVPSSSSWLRRTGLDEAIRRHVEADKRVLAICGGLQIAGQSFTDLASVEGTGHGIGLLDLRTNYEADKIQRRRTFTFGHLDGAWKELSGLTVDGYEIRHGRTDAASEYEIIPDGVGFVRRNILAIYFHGLLENANALSAVLGTTMDPNQGLENTFDALAKVVHRYLDMPRIERAVFG